MRGEYFNCNRVFYDPEAVRGTVLSYEKAIYFITEEEALMLSFCAEDVLMKLPSGKTLHHFEKVTELDILEPIILQEPTNLSISLHHIQ